jgi:hypothetical protein
MNRPPAGIVSSSRPIWHRLRRFDVNSLAIVPNGPSEHAFCADIAESERSSSGKSSVFQASRG